MSLKIGDKVRLVDGFGNLLGVAVVEKIAALDRPWALPRHVIRYSGAFEPTPEWTCSDVRALFGQIDDAINDGSFAVVDLLEKELHAKNVKIGFATDENFLPVQSILIYSETALEWIVAADE
jgi:hypothetical protein